MCVFVNFSWENHATQLQEPQLVDGLFVELLVCKVTRENTMAGNVWPLYFPTSSSTWDPLIWETHWLCIWPSFGSIGHAGVEKGLGKIRWPHMLGHRIFPQQFSCEFHLHAQPKHTLRTFTNQKWSKYTSIYIYMGRERDVCIYIYMWIVTSLFHLYAFHQVVMAVIWSCMTCWKKMH